MSELNAVSETLTHLGGQLATLSKLFDEKMENLLSNIQRLSETMPQIETELTAAEKSIQDVETKIEKTKVKKTGQQDQSKTLDNNIKVATETLDLTQKDKDKLESANKDLDAQIKQEEYRKSRLDTEIEQSKLKVKDLSARIGARKKANESEFDEKRLHLEQVKRELTQIDQSEPAIAFILTESSKSIPEVEILRVLMADSKANLDTIKKHVNLPPALVSRTLVRLAKVGILDYDENRGTVNLRIAR